MAETARRVALVLGTSTGGVGRHVRMLAGGLAREGRQVVVIGPASTDEAFGFSGVAGFAGVPISDRPRPAADLRAVARLRTLLAGADVVHAHGLRAGALAALALAGRRTALVVTLHNALTAGGAVGAIYGLLERIVAKKADQVLVVAPDLGERMTALGARHVAAAVVPAPPLSPATRTPAEVRAELRAGPRAESGRSNPAESGAEPGRASGAADVGAEPDRAPRTAAAGAEPGEVSDAVGVGAEPGVSDGAEAGAVPARVSDAVDVGGEPGRVSDTVDVGGEPGGVSGDLVPQATPGDGAAGAREGGGPILLTIARLAQQKGLETLLDAARGPYAEGAAPLFVVAGDGPLRGELRSRVEAEGLPVLLLGDRADVADLLQAADALVSPSRWEGQPLNVQEALRAAKPIVATAVGGVPAMVGDAALLVPPGDAAALREAIARLIADPALAARLSAAAAARPLPDEQAALRAAATAYEAARATATGHA
ncbi:glycosyltransferase family 4 protein [Sphaerisporangium rhizosphaerae]|uniref:Glycosyltransferase family 4 protein n=1 Tax=Sphaerisporangium rhizosphaerae TaxID=2269375 RepID=A0ABW2PEF4_9ACTN